MSLTIHTLIRHRRCGHCTKVEEKYINLQSSATLMDTVGELVRGHAENAHGPVKVHNFSHARRELDKDYSSEFASSNTKTGSSNISVDWSSDSLPSPQQQPASDAVDEDPGGPAEPASGDEEAMTAGGPAKSASGDEEATTAGGPAESALGDEEATTAGGGGGSIRRPGRLRNITAVVDWTSSPTDRDTLHDVDMLSLTDDQCMELRDYLRLRQARDLIVLEYSLAT